MSKFFMGCICLDITILQKMESEGAGEHFVEQADGSSHVVWTSAISAYMLSNLASLVAEGIRTSTGFKKVHLNMCAKALNDYFKMKLTEEQVKNHLRTWKRRYAKINRLRKLSAASWNEDNYMITLDHEHYANYVQDHKSDAEFLNKPLENYKEMFTVFGKNMATGKYAKGSSEALGTEDRNSMAETEIDEGDVNVVPSPIDDIGASSSAPRPRKKAKVTSNEEAGLIGAFKDGAERLAMAIEKAGSDDLPPDLLQTLQSIPGFDDTHKAFYFAYLVKNPRLARQFPTLPLTYQISLLARFVSETFP
ncbi:uncharacterized protein [Zea mays]|uniref:uncharacterized protein n=1 Tax=Zea mays TaxID=4577 RepID=UPI001653154B|nr:uncharacterized protein LOC118473173 [Zea mays]